MSLVNKDEMTALRPASEARSTAQTAEDEIQLMAVAFAINQASNTGEYRVEFQEQLRDAVKSELESNGYKIIFLGDVYNKERHAIISWKEQPVQQLSEQVENSEEQTEQVASED